MIIIVLTAYSFMFQFLNSTKVLTADSLTFQFLNGTKANKLTSFVFGTKLQSERMHYDWWLPCKALRDIEIGKVMSTKKIKLKVRSQIHRLGKEKTTEKGLRKTNCQIYGSEAGKSRKIVKPIYLFQKMRTFSYSSSILIEYART